MQLSCPSAIPYKLSRCSTCMSSLKLIGQTVFKLESGNHTRTDGQTDVGHINLIGGLVTRNPPKNVWANVKVLLCSEDTVAIIFNL